MSRSQTVAAAAILLGLGWMPTGSQAAPIVETFAFKATGFRAGAPFDPVSGRVTILYDLDVTQGPTPAPSFSSTLPAASYGPFFFTYFAQTRLLEVGDNCIGGVGVLPQCSVTGGTTQDFLAFGVDAAGLPEPNADFAYGTASSISPFGGEAVVSVATGAGTPIPEPTAPPYSRPACWASPWFAPRPGLGPNLPPTFLTPARTGGDYRASAAFEWHWKGEPP